VFYNLFFVFNLTFISSLTFRNDKECQQNFFITVRVSCFTITEFADLFNQFKLLMKLHSPIQYYILTYVASHYSIIFISFLRKQYVKVDPPIETLE